MIINKSKYYFDGLGLPEVCPVCSGDIVIQENGEVKCANPLCSSKVAHKIEKFFDTFEIKGAGPAYFDAASKDCKGLEDYFNSITKNDKDSIKWAGGVNGTKIYEKVNKVLAKEVKVSDFLAIFDIEDVGRRRIEQIQKNANNYDINFFLKQSKYHQYIGEGLKDTMAVKVYEGIKTALPEIEACLKFFKISGKAVEKKEGALSGMSFCFTGAAVRPRKELEKLVVDNGGTLASVKKGLSYLVTDDTESGSSKNVKAKQLGTPIITSTDFLKLVGEA